MVDKLGAHKIAGGPLDFRLDRRYVVALFWLFTSLRFRFCQLIGRSIESEASLEDYEKL
jgi:hypothetical protein